MIEQRVTRVVTKGSIHADTQGTKYERRLGRTEWRFLGEWFPGSEPVKRIPSGDSVAPSMTGSCNERRKVRPTIIKAQDRCGTRLRGDQCRYVDFRIKRRSGS